MVVSAEGEKVGRLACGISTLSGTEHVPSFGAIPLVPDDILFCNEIPGTIFPATAARSLRTALTHDREAAEAEDWTLISAKRQIRRSAHLPALQFMAACTAVHYTYQLVLT